MATARAILNTRYESKDGTYPIVIRVIDGARQIQYNTGYKIKDSQWLKNAVVKHTDKLLINNKIAGLLISARNYIAECKEKRRPVDFNLIFRKKQSHSFVEYLSHRADQYKAKGQGVMRLKCARFVRELKECFAGEVYFDDLTQDEMRGYDAYLIGKGNTANTRHKKYKFLGMFFQAAIQEGKTDTPNPFKQYRINTTPVKKDKLSAEQIVAIEDLKLSGPVSLARDLFLFSYYAKGARFENCITIRRDEIKDGRIYFRTNKGKKYISVLIHARLKAIVDKYDGPFIFPYVTKLPDNPERYRQLIGSLNVVVNRNLKIVAALAGIETKISFHIARHSFAYALKQKTDSIHVIQDSLGHSNSRVTEVYLKSLDDERLDSEMKKLYGD